MMDAAQVKRIVVPTDFSEASSVAEAFGVRVAEKFGAEVLLVHIAEDPYVSLTSAAYPGAPLTLDIDKLRGEIRAECEARLREWRERIPAAVRSRAIFRFGKAFVEIIRVAREENADLIVIGTHGRTGLRHMIIGSVAEKVVRKARIPVLTVRPDAHEFELP
ncbi:MAG: universal stress protein [Myxococcales bacterium]|nr:universal stress protein [Myxococcales bacterium]